MHTAATPVDILLVEDNPGDVRLVIETLKETGFPHRVLVAVDGLEALRMLRDSGATRRARPGLILLDLNMPRMDGRTVLKHIKADPELRRIPVIVLTTSKAEEDILRTYDLGVSSFITKPVSFEGLVDVVRTLNHYWIEIVELPASEAA